MQRLTYSELLNRLDDFDAWLCSLGVKLRPNDRLHEAFKVLRRAEDASRKGRETGIYIDISPGDWFPIVEALEAHDVFAAFQNDPSPAIAAALNRALSGPIQPIDENPKNRDGRNIWFELTLAAEWKLRGASVSLGEPDLCLTRGGLTFLVACKRPAHEKSIQTNMRDAVRQLQRNLGKTPDNVFGVAAISLSCVLNDGNQVFSGEMNALGGLLENELNKCEPYLRTVHHPKICAVILHVATPGLGGSEVDLVRASFTVGRDLTPSLGSRIFGQHPRDMGSKPKQFWKH
jgi:hypothetical protein